MRNVILVGALMLLAGCSSYSAIKTDTSVASDNENVSTTIVNGFGKTVTSDGAIYEGEHLNGQFHGRGKLILSDGSYFLGRMKYDKVDKGTMYFTDGSTMEIR